MFSLFSYSTSVVFLSSDSILATFGLLRFLSNILPFHSLMAVALTFRLFSSLSRFHLSRLSFDVFSCPVIFYCSEHGEVFHLQIASRRGSSVAKCRSYCNYVYVRGRAVLMSDRSIIPSNIFLTKYSQNLTRLYPIARS